MSKNIRFKRGNKSNMPSSAPSGMPLWCEDTEELYIGTGNGRSKVGGDSVTEALVNQKLNNYVPKTQLASKNQKGIMQVGSNLDVNDSGQVSGVKIKAGTVTSVVQNYTTTLSAVCTNSNLSISLNYTGTKDHAGTEVLEFVAGSDSLDSTKYSGGTLDVNRVTRYFIKNGYLFYHNNIAADDITQVGSLSGWSCVVGAGVTSTTHCSYGICNGQLYGLHGATAEKVSNLSGWTYVSGSYSYYNTGYYECAYGICNGYLYLLKGSDITQLGTSNQWTQIEGYYTYISSYTSYAYGICGGSLYALQESTLTKVGSLTNWTDISGQSTVASDYKNYSYGIAGGYLYYIYGTTATKLGTLSGWTKVTGKHSSYTNENKQYAYGIRNGYLYAIDATTATQVGTSNGWTNIIGYSTNYVTNSNHTYAFGICNGYLYGVQATNLLQLSNSNKWTYISGNPTSESGNVGAYGICNNEMFGIRVTELYQLSTCTWLLNGSAVGLTDYGISVTGTINFGDKITATYLTELTNTISYTAPYIVSQTVSGAYHCRKWSNKFCEQWSQFAGSGKSGTITLPQAYKDTNYVLVSAEGGHNSLSATDTDGVDFVCLFSNITATSFRYSSASGRQFTWYTAGYIN